MALAFRVLLQYLDLNDIYSLKNFLDSNSFQVDERDDNGATILMHAATRGVTSFVKELVLRGADIQAEDLDNWTALLCATKAGHSEIVQYLLDHGADIEHREMGGWTPLMWASYKGHTEIVNLLLERGADVHIHGNYHLSPLLWAAGRGHYDAVVSLINKGAKVNSADKYGTTALIWACRKGATNIVDFLLKNNANVDTAGMYSWTALLVAVAGGHHECVNLLLERKPNVNALDKEGMTALSIACREGYHEIVVSLIAVGAYINIQDRSSDTPLIHAVKGGHRAVVEILLKKHADIDIQGKDKKTALYYAAEKGNVTIARIILAQNPDLELETKDGDTALLRAVRNRNLEIVQMLLDKKAKVGATDKRGDNCLHIAMRARSKAIVEILLRNPKNSQLLYRANKAGETPYALDNMHQKTILSQVFGARRLNTNEDPEGVLGYELYSSALADILSEPTLKTPITIGLYAKWGSGKSFLLTKVRDEMRTFAQQWADPVVRIAFILFLTVTHICAFFAVLVGMLTWSVFYGLLTFFSIFSTIYGFLIVIKMLNRRYHFNWVDALYRGLAKRMGQLQLILQVVFCYPPYVSSSDLHTMPVRFLFSEIGQGPTKAEHAVGFMISSMMDVIEDFYGTITTRLFRALHPRQLESGTKWKYRRTCCVPNVLLFELALILFTLEICLVIIYYTNDTMSDLERGTTQVVLYAVAAVLLAGIIANFHVIARLFSCLFVSQTGKLKRQSRSDGNDSSAIALLGTEVAMISDMIKCLDAFVGQQSRLVGVIDVLDCYDIERVLNILNVMQTLVATPDRPFIILIAVDPHIVTKAAEARSKRMLTEVGSIGGHDFLRNLVHLPIYLQSSNLKKIQRAQMAAITVFGRYPESGERRLSNASELGMSTERLRTLGTSRGGSKKNRMPPDSLASSISSNIHKLGHTSGGGIAGQSMIDRSRAIFSDDFFSDINPRSLKRLNNVMSFTIRLMKAFQIDFNWYRLISWINLTEQWPLRSSIIVLEFEKEDIDDTTSLQALYERCKSKIPFLKESAVFLEMDRDERKLDAFLGLHKNNLLAADLKVFLPFTFNLDPYLKKVLKEDQQAFEEEFEMATPLEMKPLPKSLPQMPTPRLPYPINASFQPLPQMPIPQYPMNYPSQPAQSIFQPPSTMGYSNDLLSTIIASQPKGSTNKPDLIAEKDLQNLTLSKLSVPDLIKFLKRIPDLQPIIQNLSSALEQNAITGRVLMYCELNELKTVLNLNFGYWETFKLVITALRTREMRNITLPKLSLDLPTSQDVTDTHTSLPPLSPAPHTHAPAVTKKHSVSSRFEKQVTIEEEILCETLQFLNNDQWENRSDDEYTDTAGVTEDSVLTPIKESSEVGSPKRRELVRTLTIGDFEPGGDQVPSTVIAMPQFQSTPPTPSSAKMDEAGFQ